MFHVCEQVVINKPGPACSGTPDEVGYGGNCFSPHPTT